MKMLFFIGESNHNMYAFAKVARLGLFSRIVTGAVIHYCDIFQLRIMSKSFLCRSDHVLACGTDFILNISVLSSRFICSVFIFLISTVGAESTSSVDDFLSFPAYEF